MVGGPMVDPQIWISIGFGFVKSNWVGVYHGVEWGLFGYLFGFWIDQKDIGRGQMGSIPNIFQ